jgi:UDP-N-acetylglucosamine 2-epimerase (non-hydrolysing)
VVILVTSGQIKIVTIVGARPNFMKVAPIIRAIHEHNQKHKGPEINHLLVHTGQHYDEVMSDRFFADLSLPKPDVFLGVGSGSHAAQTAQILEKFEGVLLREKPQVVIVVGDVNSTLACALVAAKISFDSVGSRPVIAHVEAGLRSFDRSMPEEVNRVVTDHVSDLFFVTEESGIQNLRNEGISPDKIHFVGNTMIDSLFTFKEKADASAILNELGLRTDKGKNGASKSNIRYALLTLHRPSNVDNRDAFLNILEGLEELAADCPIVFPVHPRTQQRIKEFGSGLHMMANAARNKDQVRDSGSTSSGIILTNPLGYLDFLCLMKHATIVVTDSGGIQEETTCLGIPCVTVRENTERPVTVEYGTNIVAGTRTEGIKDAIQRQRARKGGNSIPKHWDGQAAKRIVDILIRARHEKNASRQSLIPQPCA